jgi:hypothetical protein
VLVCIGVVDVNVDELETGVVDQAAPRGVREDALRVRPAGESLPRDEPLRVGNELDPLADLLR